tara:strand:+ start:274 stop:573 length:300 start_codon:yes stop_codon:yes gene_type:complete
MAKPVSVKITKSTKSGKKLMAVFQLDNGRTKTTHFGSAGMDDYTLTKDKEQKARYISRHRRNENWNSPMTAGALSRYILWNKTSKGASITDYKRRFNLK